MFSRKSIPQISLKKLSKDMTFPVEIQTQE